jgi:phosphoglycolate phosphatase-like HAD superfamily hydrolase
MRSDGLDLAIASSAKSEEIDTLLKRMHAEDLITARTSSDEAENSKPDPDIVAAAIETIGASPSEVVMLGDTPYDVEAAARACAGAIALRCGGWDDAHLQRALAIYDDPADLLARYDSSPLGSARDAIGGVRPDERLR